MANTIAKATGGDATREKTTTRLGSRYASAQANTWRTFATVTTWADGRVTVEIERDGRRILDVQLRSEADTDAGDPPVSFLFQPVGAINDTKPTPLASLAPYQPAPDGATEGTRSNPGREYGRIS